MSEFIKKFIQHSLWLAISIFFLHALQVKADCLPLYEKKIEEKKGFLNKHQPYEKVLRLLQEVKQNKFDETFMHLVLDLQGHLKFAHFNEEIEESLKNSLKQMIEEDAFCKNSKPLPYPKLIKNFTQLRQQLKTPQSYGSMIKRLESRYQEETGCTPYNTLVNASFGPIQELAETTEASLPTVSEESSLKECPFCISDMPASAFFSFDKCGCHREACKECVGKFFGNKLKEGEIFDHCLFCKKELDIPKLVQAEVLEAQDLEKWKVLDMRKALMACPIFVPCEGDGCLDGVFLQNTKDQYLGETGCPSCGLLKCPECGKKKHPKLTCKEAWVKNAQTCQKEGLGAVACPGCGLGISRDGGCQHMTCKKCQTNYSNITRLAYDPLLDKDKDYDIGGWPIKYFYKDGVFDQDNRIDQNGRRIDKNGNLLKTIKYPLRVDGQKAYDRNGRRIYVSDDFVVSRDGQTYYEYNDETNTAIQITVPGRQFIRNVPESEFENFRGEWDEILYQIMLDQREEWRKQNK